METTERIDLVQKLDERVGLHRATWGAQLTRTPYSTFRRVVLSRRAAADREHSRSQVLVRDSFFDEQVELPFPACWDLRVYGTYIDEAELRLQKYMLRHLPSGGTFVDVGANIGFFCLLAARIVGPRGQLHAFEPGTEALRFLKRNLAHVRNITINDMAVMEAPREITFFEGTGAAMVSSSAVQSHLADRNADVTEVTVPATSLDAYVAEHGLAPDMVKVDVEGAELSVLQGASALLAQGRATFVLEISLKEDEFLENYAPCVQLLAQHGYLPHRIDPQGDPTPIDGDLLEIRGPRCSKPRGYLHGLDNITFLPPRHRQAQMT